MKYKLQAVILLLLFIFGSSAAQDFDKAPFAERREQLMEKTSDGIIVLKSFPVYPRNGDVSYEFRQGSDFFYLTGFEESESAVILDPTSPDKFTLFVQPKDPKIETWTGILTGVDDAVLVYGADRSFEIKQFDSVLNDYISGGKKIYYMRTDDWLREKIGDKTATDDVTQTIHEMRMFKSPYEMKQLKRAIDITGISLIEVMKNCEPSMYEYQLQAILEATFKMEGAQRIGFPSIVGSGPNSCILHYETNRRKTQNGDLVVMDVGAEFNYYTADVTRTFPVNGKFTPAQKRIYNIVLAAQNEAIKFIKPGVMFYQVDSVARSVVKKGLVALNLLDESENTMKFFMHGTSHWLGLDVHDVGSYNSADGTRRGRMLEAGMVLTVEPGIYIAAGTEGVPKEYYNIGVRIEDDILVTETGYEVLSDIAPKEISEIEKIMQRKKPKLLEN